MFQFFMQDAMSVSIDGYLCWELMSKLALQWQNGSPIAFW